MNKIEIPFRLPSLNQYINECRKNKYAGANMKKNVEKDIGWYINLLPEYKNPIKIHFIWVEENKRAKELRDQVLAEANEVKNTPKETPAQQVPNSPSEKEPDSVNSEENSGDSKKPWWKVW